MFTRFVAQKKVLCNHLVDEVESSPQRDDKWFPCHDAVTLQTSPAISCCMIPMSHWFANQKFYIVFINDSLSSDNRIRRCGQEDWFCRSIFCTRSDHYCTIDRTRFAMFRMGIMKLHTRHLQLTIQIC